jgi:hypothetical protein
LATIKDEKMVTHVMFAEVQTDNYSTVGRNTSLISYFQTLLKHTHLRLIRLKCIKKTVTII